MLLALNLWWNELGGNLYFIYVLQGVYYMCIPATERLRYVLWDGYDYETGNVYVLDPQDMGRGIGVYGVGDFVFVDENQWEGDVHVDCPMLCSFFWIIDVWIMIPKCQMSISGEDVMVIIFV